MAVTRAIIDIDINTSGAAASLRSLQSQVNAFNSALNKGNIAHAAAARSYSESLSQLVNTTGYFTAETVKMQTAAGRLDDTLRKGKSGIGQYFNALKRGTTEYAQVTSLAQQRAAALQTQFVATAGAAGGYRDAIAIRPIHAFSDATSVANQRLAIQRAMFNQATTSMINFGKNTQWAGRQLMVGFTVPLTIFGTLAGKTFMELEKASLQFRKVYGDAFTTPAELDANIAAVKELSKEFTKYGIAAKDTMEVAAQAAAAGAQNQELIAATTESTRLATLGQLDQQKALEATIALQNAFRLSSDELAKSVNFMNMVENQTVLTLDDMVQAIPRVAPVIKGLGGSVEDMAALLTAMKEGGVTAAQGANALKSGLASLINPTDAAVEKLGKLGININAIIQGNRGDLMATVTDFATELSKLNNLQQQQILENVFGKYQYARLGALFKNIIKDGTQASRVLDMAGLSAQQMAATAEKELGMIAESPATKFTAAMERMRLEIAPIGEMFVKIATPIIDVFGRLLSIFNQLPEPVKNIGAIGTILVGLVIPAGTMFLGLLMNLVGTLLKFGNIMKLAFSGFAKGGMKGAIDAVSQSLRYMSLAEMDTAQAALQLGESTTAVSSAFRSQVPAAADATLAIDRLGGAYARLAILMQEAAASSPAFAVPGAAFGRAGRRRSVRRNRGGTIPGTGNTDTVPAMLTPGEFVINKQATAQNLPLLQAINNGYNKGGYVQYFARNMSQRVVEARSRVPRNFRDALDVLEAENAANIAAAGRFGGLRRIGFNERIVSAAERALSPTIKLRELRGKTINEKKTLERMARDLTDEEQDLFEISTLGALVLRLPDQKLNNRLNKPNGLAAIDALRAIEDSGLSVTQIFEPMKYQMNGFLKAKQGVAGSLDIDEIKALSLIKQQLAELGQTPIKDADFSKIVRSALESSMSGSEVQNFMSAVTRGRSFRIFKDKALTNDEWADSLKNELGRIGSSAQVITRKEKDGKVRVWLEKDGERYEITPNYETGNLDLGDGILPYERLRTKLKLPKGSGLALTHVNSGGMIPGQGNKDTVPAMLTPGEYVINKQATAENLPLLKAINDGNLSKFANGGYVLKPEPYVNADGASGMDYVVYDKRGNPVEIFASGREAREFIRRRTIRGRISNAGRSVASGVRSAFVRPTGGVNPMGVSMGLGAVGGAAMMAPMIPAIGQNESLSNMAGMAGMGLSLASIIPMLNKAAGPVAGLAIAAAAAGGSLYVMRKSLDDTAKEAAKIGASLGGAANRMEEFTKATGYQFARDRVGMRSFRFTKTEAAAASEFATYFESEEGQKMIADLKELSPEQRYKEVASIISMAIADGMDEKTAKAYGDAIAYYASDAILKQRLASDLKRGQFGKGSRAMIDLVKERQLAATTPLIAPPAMATSPISQALGTSGATNIWGEAAAVTGAGALAGAGIGALATSWGGPLSIAGAAVGAVIGTLVGGTVAFIKAKSAMDELNKSMETVAKTFGSSIQVLKELDNAEALLLEERRNGEITQKEFVKRQKELDAVRESQAGRLKEAVKIAVDTGATEQSITDQLTLGGFDGAVAGAVARSLSREDVAQKMFQQSYDDLSDASKEVVGSVIANVLSGMTPENAASKIAEIESVYAVTAQTLVGAAVDGLTQAEIDTVVLKKQLNNWASSIFGEVGLDTVLENIFNKSQINSLIDTYSQQLSALGIDPEELKKRFSGLDVQAIVDELGPIFAKFGINIESILRNKFAFNVSETLSGLSGYFERLGLSMEEVTAGLSSLSNQDLAISISTDEEKAKTFGKLLSMLSDPKYKQIEIEVATNYMFDRNWTPATLVKKVDEAAKQINKIDFKQFENNFKEIENMAPNPMAFINFAMSIGTAMKDIPAMYENALKGVDVIADNFKKNINKSGKVKVTVEMLTQINGSTVTNGKQVAAKLNSMFPKGLPPILVPVLLQIPNLNLGMNWLGKGGKFKPSQEIADWFAAGNTADDAGSPGSPVTSKALAIQYEAAWKASQSVAGLEAISSLLPTPTTGTGGDNSGGGDKQKSLFQQLKDQMKFARKMFDAIRELMYNETKKGVRFDKQFNKFIAGPFAPEFLEYLRSQGEQGLKIINGGIAKVREAYKNFVMARSSEMATQLLYLPRTMQQEMKNNQLELGMRRRLADEGRSGAEIDFIVERTDAMRKQWQANKDLIDQEMKKKKGDRDTAMIKRLREENEVIRKRRVYIEENAAAMIKQEQLLAQQGALQDLTDELDKGRMAMEYMAKGVAPDLAQQLADISNGQLLSDEQIKDAVDKIKRIRAIAEDPIELQLSLIDVRDQITNLRAEIEIQERIQKELSDEIAAKGLSNAQQYLDALNAQSDAINRQIELEQRKLEPIDEQIDKYNKQKEEINKAFDERLKALDEIEQANRRIFDLQQGQLNIAQALSRGDVSAAAQASMELQQTMAENRQQDIRDALENARAMQLEAIDKRINDLRKQREDIDKEIKRLQEEQRLVQDEIYNAEKAIRDITVQVNKEYGIGAQNIDAMKLRLTQLLALENDILQKIKDANAERAKAGLPLIGGGTSGTGGTDAGSGSTIPSGGINISDTYWDSNTKQVKFISNKQPVTGTVYNTANRTKKAYVNGFSNGTWTPYAKGGFVAGVGNRDSVPALLTPGEFVVRKPVARALGPILDSINSNVFPKMNLSAPGIGLNNGAGSSPVQYNYDISVNVSGTNASPDEIANVVMNKIKMTQDRNIRSYRY